MSAAWEAMRSGAPHQPYDPDLKARRARCRELLWRYNTQIPPGDSAAQQALLAELFGELPEGIHITPPFHCDYGRGIRFGRHFYANSGCTILDGGAVHIGDHVLFAPNVALYTVGHPLHPALRRTASPSATPAAFCAPSPTPTASNTPPGISAPNKIHKGVTHEKVSSTRIGTLCRRLRRAQRKPGTNRAETL